MRTSWGLLAALIAGGCGSDAGGVPTELDAGAQLYDAGAGAPEDASDRAVQVSAQVTGLAGEGLVLRTAAGEIIEVAGDGKITFPQPLALSANQVLEVVTQPTDPAQTCSVQIAGAAVKVSCTTNRYLVGGRALGLSGEGMILHASWGESLPLDHSGTFAFSERVPDLATYEVIVGSQPSRPRQTCSVERGQGSVAGSDVTDILVDCTTQTFRVSGRAVGVLGSGLELQLVGRETLAVQGTGNPTFAFASEVPDASPFEVRVKTQPVNPSQRCVVVDGDGTLDGEAKDVAVVCGALGGLRISEIGSCYYADSACWVELFNAGEVVEELSYYQLRTPALRPGSPVHYEPSQTFTLPLGPVHPGEYALVRAKSKNALPDGSRVVHVRSPEGHLPWWNVSGFAELSSNGIVVDFVRFGSSSASPGDPDAWSGADNAPSLPSGEKEYGRSIARGPTVHDGDHPSDWSLRAFATPGGPNDVTLDADVDADGVPDVAELPGGKFAGLDLYAMGARVGARDLFVELDRMSHANPAVMPRKEALDSVVRAFRDHGVAVHFDAGDLFSPSFDPVRYNLGNADDVVPFAQAVSIGDGEDGVANLYDYKAAYMAAARRTIFYYQLFGWSQNQDGSGGSSGIGERPGNDSIITLGGFGLKDGSEVQRNLLTNYQAATMMHELGHNLSLRHGGGDDLNRKPNYVSVMNYLYSPLGLPTIGEAEGDRYDYQLHCTLVSLSQLTNPPTGSPTAFVLDYSSGLGADIDETRVEESEGVGRVTSQSVDFNCNKEIDAPYERDLNYDGRKNLLQDYDDWTNLTLVFRRSYSGNENGPTLFSFRASEPVDDLLTDDVQPVTDQPCPPLRLPEP